MILVRVAEWEDGEEPVRLAAREIDIAVLEGARLAVGRPGQDVRSSIATCPSILIGSRHVIAHPSIAAALNAARTVETPVQPAPA